MAATPTGGTEEERHDERCPSRMGDPASASMWPAQLAVHSFATLSPMPMPSSANTRSRDARPDAEMRGTAIPRVRPPRRSRLASLRVRNRRRTERAARPARIARRHLDAGQLPISQHRHHARQAQSSQHAPKGDRRACLELVSHRWNCWATRLNAAPAAIKLEIAAGTGQDRRQAPARHQERSPEQAEAGR